MDYNMTDGDRNRAIHAEAVARAWREPAYLERLKKAPKATLLEAGMVLPGDTEVVLLENTPKVLNVVFPTKAEMPRYQAQLQKALQLLPDLPEWMELRIHRNSPTRQYFVIAAPPSAAEELTDQELELVAGGKGETTAPPQFGAITSGGSGGGGSYGGSTLGVLMPGSGDIGVNVTQAANVAQVAVIVQVATVQSAAAVTSAFAVGAGLVVAFGAIVLI